MGIFFNKFYNFGSILNNDNQQHKSPLSMQPINKNLPRFDGNLTACILWCDGQALSTTSVTRDML